MQRMHPRNSHLKEDEFYKFILEINEFESSGKIGLNLLLKVWKKWYWVLFIRMTKSAYVATVSEA